MWFTSESVLKAENEAKKASKKWALTGKPRDDENELFKAKRLTKQNLNKAINDDIRIKSREENNTMMYANFRDTKWFSKLFNKNCKNNLGYTAMLKVVDTEYRRDAQVLFAFFAYHDGNSTPPPINKTNENTTYFYSTINVQAISYIVKQRKWKLPQLNLNQVQNIIERLKSNKSADYFGFSAKHVKNGGFVSTHFLRIYINLSFKHIEYGVPEEELIGCGSLVHKSGNKILTDTLSFRKIIVCALLGQIKQMAVCDLALPLLKTLKPHSQLGFTRGLFVKLANIIVTNKKALAITNNQVVLHQFLDAVAAFDETLHPIILNQMYNGEIQDDLWSYFHLLHKNSTTHIKWNGRTTVQSIREGKGNRQGGLASGDELKLYNNQMIKQLEEEATISEKISYPIHEGPTHVLFLC